MARHRDREWEGCRAFIYLYVKIACQPESSCQDC